VLRLMLAFSLRLATKQLQSRESWRSHFPFHDLYSFFTSSSQLSLFLKTRRARSIFSRFPAARSDQHFFMLARIRESKNALLMEVHLNKPFPMAGFRGLLRVKEWKLSLFLLMCGLSMVASPTKLSSFVSLLQSHRMSFMIALSLFLVKK